MKTLTFEEFLEQPVTHTFKEQDLQAWDKLTFQQQMQDIYGEAVRLLKFYHENNAALQQQWHVFDEFCAMTYLGPSTNKNEAETLKIAEWELYDYVFGSNSWQNTRESVMRWFNQWIFDINYDAIDK